MKPFKTWAAKDRAYDRANERRSVARDRLEQARKKVESAIERLLEAQIYLEDRVEILNEISYAEVLEKP